MPRNITVTFADGSSHVYRNAPDNITPDQVTARAQTDFGKPVKALDGGRGAAPTMTQPPTPRSPAPVPVKTRAQEIQDIARKQVDAQSAHSVLPKSVQDFDSSVSAGMASWLPFEAPDRIGAAIMHYSGLGQGKSYQDELAIQRAITAEQRRRSDTGNAIGSIVGAVEGGAGLSKGISAIGTKLASTGAPAVNAIGRALAASQNLVKGQKLANVGKLAATGAGYSAADSALNQDSLGSVAANAALGAIVGPAAAAGLKSFGWLGSSAAKFLGLKGAGTVLRNLVGTTAEDLQQRATDFRQRTGAEPTVYELLDKADRQKFAKAVVGSSGPAQDAGAAAVRSRVANVAPEMQAQAQRTFQPARQSVIDRMQQDLADTQGTTSANLAPEQIQSVQAASQAPVDLETLRGQQTKNIMDPVRDQIVAPHVEALFPTTLTTNAQGNIVQVHSDPEANAAIRNAAGSLRLRQAPSPNPAGLPTAAGNVPDGITGDDMANIIQRLEQTANRDGPDRGAAERALEQVRSVTSQNAPHVLDAIDAMRASHAATSRMMEGMGEGNRTRLREDVPVTSRAAAQDVTNAYDTPEGAAGRLLGQTNTLERSFAGTPEDAIRSVQQLAENSGTREALARNVGAPEAADLIGGAQAQAQSIRNLAPAASSASGETLDPTDLTSLAHGLMALHPGSLPTTKLYGLNVLKRMVGISQPQAEFLINKLMSQDPAQTAQGISLLNNAGRQGQEFLRQLGTSIIGANAADTQANPLTDAQPIAPSAPVEDLSASPPAPVDAGENSSLPAQTVESPAPSAPPPQQPEIDPNRPYGRQVVEQLFPGAEITDDVRDPNSTLGKENPGSYHVKSQNAVDVRPIPGMTFNDFLGHLQNNGHQIIEAIDEVNHPSKYATGKHWHVVLG